MLIRNRYEFDETNRLGQGGFGETFEAKDRDRFGELCVVKRLKCNQQDSNFAYIREMFEQEAKVLLNLGEAIEQIPALKHQIPKLHAYFTEDNFFYLVQQLIVGETLAKKIQTGALDERQIRQFLSDILPVLQMIHERNIVHRDIKPSNLIIRASDGKPVLIDFGIVKAIAKASSNTGKYGDCSTQIGTAEYSPPEQINGEAIYPYTDIYSLGITTIHALTGKSPKLQTRKESLEHWSVRHTGSDGWRKFAPNVSRELGQILDKAIQLDPRKRYSSARDMLAAIQRLPALPEPPALVQPTQPDPDPTAFRTTSRVASRVAAKPSRLTFIIIGLMSAATAVLAGYFYSNYRLTEANRSYQSAQADLKKIEDLKQQGNHQACIAEAQRFTQSHTLSYLNPTAEAEQLGSECALASVQLIQTVKARGDNQACIAEYERFTKSNAAAYTDAAAKAKQLATECSTALELQNYFQVDLPEQMRNKQQTDEADVLGKIKPTVQIDGRQVTVIYDGSANPKYTTDASTIKAFAAFFISALKGQTPEFQTTKYDDFSELVVYPTQGKVKATIAVEQWDAYLKKFKQATSTSETERLRAQFINEIQISPRP